MGKAGKQRKRRRLAAAVGAGPDGAGVENGASPMESEVEDGEGCNGVSDPRVQPTAQQADIDVDMDDDAPAGPSAGLPSGVTAWSAAIRDEDFATTLRTISLLSRRADLFRAKECKPLRASLHILNQQLLAIKKETSLAQKPHVAPKPAMLPVSTFSARVTEALATAAWEQALSLLQEMRTQGKIPKLGTLQRWVRVCDAAGGADFSSGESSDPRVLRVLDAMLRAVDPQVADGASSEPLGPVTLSTDGTVCWSAPWVAPVPPATDATPVDAQPRSWLDCFRVVAFEKGAERRPPNQYDINIYLSTPGTVDLSPPRAVQRLAVPGVPGAFLLSNIVDADPPQVLAPQECAALLAASEAMGYEPDVPLAGSRSVLAHNFFWLTDDSMLAGLWQRCQPLLPRTLGGCSLLGINARWRFYRYTPGVVYRPHIDGAWPGSGMRDGQYVYDAFNGDRRSRLTFLIYLNEDFEGGCTTFFLPSSRDGVLSACPVRPRTGAVLCFPHGDTAGSLLHEGSAVLRGAKYVIRTDVLYSLPLAKP